MAPNYRSSHVIIPTDVFPPGKVGGAAWSSHALALALLERGHRVTVVVPKRGVRGVQRRDMDGLQVVEVGYSAPHIPFIQNYFRYERLWPRLRNVIIDVAQQGDRAQSTLIHAQHAQTGPAAVLAGRALGVPTVVTVRDHWPWDYFATGLHADRLPYPRNTWQSLLTDLPLREGPLRGAIAAFAIPYMLNHVRRRARLLARADAVIAVSNYIARRLQGVVPSERVHVVPNMVDGRAIDQALQVPSISAPTEPFVLAVGKLERNKGMHLLPHILRGQPSNPLLLIAGDGSLRSELEQTLAAEGIRFQLLPGWTEHDEVLRLMACAEVLVFPSAWGEPLSRVLIEASAAGACILAQATGGTTDIIVDRQSGVLGHSPEALHAQLAALLADPLRRVRLRQGARAQAQAVFRPAVVIAQVEAVYAVARENTTEARRDEG